MSFHCTDDQAVCRGCGKRLDGSPYWKGGSAYIPQPPGSRLPRARAKSCHYGGWVCSEICDRRACLDLEQTMPGHGRGQTRLDGNLGREIREKWSDQ